MRALRRPNVLLPTLQTGKGSAAAQANLGRYQKPVPENFEFPDHWNEADVRGALYAMHGRACAYCQCNLPHGDRGDIEHFRPKDLYWWLAYEFFNYFLSCRACNSGRKRNRFPLAAGAVPCRFEDRAALAQEAAILLDPASDPVERWTRFQLEDPNFLFPLAPVDTLSPAERVRVEATIEFFNFNGDALLVKERREVLQTTLKTLQRALQGDTDSQVELQRMASRHRPFGIAVRQLIEQAAPSLLPNPEEELLYLLFDFVEELETLRQILNQSPKNAAAKKQRDEVCYALAFLWKQPPAASPPFVEKLLDRKGCRAEVEPYYAKLVF